MDTMDNIRVGDCLFERASNAVFCVAKITEENVRTNIELIDVATKSKKLVTLVELGFEFIGITKRVVPVAQKQIPAKTRHKVGAFFLPLMMMIFDFGPNALFQSFFLTLCTLFCAVSLYNLLWVNTGYLIGMIRVLFIPLFAYWTLSFFLKVNLLFQYMIL